MKKWNSYLSLCKLNTCKDSASLICYEAIDTVLCSKFINALICCLYLQSSKRTMYMLYKFIHKKGKFLCATKVTYVAIHWHLCLDRTCRNI